jgi:hypothetical protein
VGLRLLLCLQDSLAALAHFVAEMTPVDSNTISRTPSAMR